MTDLQKMAMTLPPMADPLVKNGISMALGDYLQSKLAEYGLAKGLAEIFGELITEDRYLSETLGAYSRTINQKETFAERQQYWNSQAIAGNFGNADLAPSVLGGASIATYPFLAGVP